MRRNRMKIDSLDVHVTTERIKSQQRPNSFGFIECFFNSISSWVYITFVPLTAKFINRTHAFKLKMTFKNTHKRTTKSNWVSSFISRKILVILQSDLLDYYWCQASRLKSSWVWRIEILFSAVHWFSFEHDAFVCFWSWPIAISQHWCCHCCCCALDLSQNVCDKIGQKKDETDFFLSLHQCVSNQHWSSECTILKCLKMRTTKPTLM